MSGPTHDRGWPRAAWGRLVRASGLAAFLVVLALGSASVAGCGRDGAAEPLQGPTRQPAPTAVASEGGPEPGERPFPTRLPAAERLVAVGDLHGSLAATRAVLRLAGLIGSDDRWTGGSTVLVQTGDVLDRGDDELAILELLESLTQQARAAGGAVHRLNGNHELMNVAGDLRYVSPKGFSDFAEADEQGARDPAFGHLPFVERGRAAAFRPGGFWARKLASQPIVLVVGDTLFAHGSVLPAHVTHGLERLNQQSRAWLEGRSASGRGIVSGRGSPVWLRTFGGSEGPFAGADTTDCALLGRTLEIARVARMVVGHTIQKSRPTSACGDRIWRIDVGMGSVPSAVPYAIEIVADRVRVLDAASAAEAAATGSSAEPSGSSSAAAASSAPSSGGAPSPRPRASAAGRPGASPTP